MRIAVFATCPKGTVSGGRYHALMIAAVLARRGHECWFVTNNEPVFFLDLQAMTGDTPIRLVTTPEFDVAAGAPFDAVFVAPQMSAFPRFVANALRFAREAGAAPILINYESANWFNALSPTPRPVANWDDWLRIAREGALVLCSAEESRRWAEAFYTDLPPTAAFDVWQPAVDTPARDAATRGPREKSIVVFCRPGDAHKGGGDVAELIDPSLSGHRLDLVVGNPNGVEAFAEDLRERGRRCGVDVAVHVGLSDQAKFELLGRAAALVFPSRFEGYGYPPLEALASDTPCVAYDLPVVRENAGDLIRYAPIGDVAALRARLLEALAAGPVATSTDPRVVRLTDVDHRGEALEAVLLRHLAHRAEVAATVPAPVDAALSPASIVRIDGRTLAWFTLTTTLPLRAVAPASPNLAAARLVEGGWVDGAWTHGILLTLADDARPADLAASRLALLGPSSRWELALDRLTTEERAVPLLPPRSLALTAMPRTERRALLAGWLYPEIAYDALLLVDATGRPVRTAIAIRNDHYERRHPADAVPACGFLSEIVDLADLADGPLDVLLFDRGGIVGRGRLDAAPSTVPARPLTVVGHDPTSPEKSRRDVPTVEALADGGLVTPACRDLGPRAATAPRVHRASSTPETPGGPSAMDHDTSTQLFGRRFGYDRWQKKAFVKGWVLAPEGSWAVDALLGGRTAVARVEVGANRPLSRDEAPSPGAADASWSFTLPLPDEVDLDQRLDLRLLPIRDGMVLPTPVATCSIPLRDFEDLSLGKLIVSDLKLGEEDGSLRLKGWWGGALGEPHVSVWFLGRRIGRARMRLPRADVLRNFPWLGRSDLGWLYEGDRPSWDQDAALEVRLEDQGITLASVVVPFDKARGPKAERRLEHQRLTAKIHYLSTGRIDRLLASEAFRRRWVKGGPQSLAGRFRAMLAEELIKRREVDREIVFRLASGDLVSANPALDMVIARQFLLKGGYESGFVAWVESIVRPGDVVVDGGAAYGTVSMAAARRGGRVVAVDANPRMIERLRRNFALNGGEAPIEVVNAALMDRADEQVQFLNSTEGNFGSSRVVQVASDAEYDAAIAQLQSLPVVSLDAGRTEDRKASYEKASVTSVSLDSLCETRGLRDVVFVKMDIEGAEMTALRGASRLLRGDFGRPPIVALEYSHVVPSLEGTPEDIWTFFADRGWSIYVLAEGKERGGRPKRIESIETAPHHDNVIFVPPERLDRIETA